MKKLFILMLMEVLTISGFSQIPQKISYQCVIRNSLNGLVTNHAVGMKISILQGSAAGPIVYIETQTPATNANGLATIEIGSGTVVSGTFAGINWSAGTYFIKTETDPTGGTNYTITGTSQLLSVPYAMYSKTAQTADYNSLSNLPVLNITNWNTAFGWGNHSGLYRQISWVPAWPDIAGKPGFATVATSGSYNDLINKPGLFDGSWANITGKPVTISGYGITDAVTITGTQTITGIKTFNNELLVNGLTIGKGNNAVTSNTAIGNSVLFSNTTGYDNTANGYRALYYNTEGYRNTANGYRALFFNTIGYRNTANGYHALYSNTVGYNNTANGYGALNSNTTGYENTVNGYAALYSNTTGNNNTANGSNALYSSTSGSNNTSIGYNALYSNITGFKNTANGYNALYSNTTASNNTANGSFALFSNTTGFGNTANGYDALYSNTTASFNTANGNAALNSNTTGDYNTAIGNSADVTSANLTNATAIGNGAKVNASNKVRIGNSNVTVIEGQVNWSVGSDMRLKENIGYSDKLGLEFVNGLETVTFTYKNDPYKRHHDGLIAQDVKNVLDKSGLAFSGLVESDNEEKILNLSYSEFVIPLINSVKELNNKNQGQQKQIENLEEEINELKFLVNSLIAKKTKQGNM